MLRGWFLVWEDVLVQQCRLLLQNVVLQVDVDDKWKWHLDPVTSYSMKGDHYLSSPTQQVVNFSSELLWHSEVPVKVSLLVWRLFAIDFLRRIVYSEGASVLKILSSVWEVVGRGKPQIICSLNAIILALFDKGFVVGLVFPLWNRLILLIIVISFVIYKIVTGCVALF